MAPIYARLGEAALARRWFQVARDYSESKAKETYKPMPYRWLAEAHAKAGEFGEALATADGIADRTPASPRWEALQNIAAAQARAGDTPGAMTTARSIVNESSLMIRGGVSSRRQYATMAVATEQIRAGDYAGAAETFKEMEPSIAKQLVLYGLAAACIASESAALGTRRASARSWMSIRIARPSPCRSTTSSGRGTTWRPRNWTAGPTR